MKIEQAIEILKHFQIWRMGDIDDLDYTPKELSEAINFIIEYHDGNI